MCLHVYSAIVEIRLNIVHNCRIPLLLYGLLLYIRMIIVNEYNYYYNYALFSCVSQYLECLLFLALRALL